MCRSLLATSELHRDLKRWKIARRLLAKQGPRLWGTVAEYRFESTVSEERTPLSSAANSVSSARTSVSSRLHTNNRLTPNSVSPKELTWVHQNRASPFASDFYRRRGYRREFHSEDHFYLFSSQKKSRFASDFLCRGNRASWGLKKSRDFSGSGKNRRRNRGASRDFGALRNSLSSVFETVLPETVFGPFPRLGASNKFILPSSGPLRAFSEGPGLAGTLRTQTMALKGNYDNGTHNALSTVVAVIITVLIPRNYMAVTLLITVL